MDRKKRVIQLIDDVYTFSKTEIVALYYVLKEKQTHTDKTDDGSDDVMRGDFLFKHNRWRDDDKHRN